MPELHGRKQIFSEVSVIDSGNIIEVLSHAVDKHELNRVEIEYLYNYDKGLQPILQREKKYRKDICNKIVVNIAHEIVAFKNGYSIGEPIQYVSRTSVEGNLASMKLLNDSMILAGKELADRQIYNWMHICGVGYRYIKWDEAFEGLRIYSLDPRNTFVVYANDVAKTPLMAVTYIALEDGEIKYRCYTNNMAYTIESPSAGASMAITEMDGYTSPTLPIIEYRCGEDMMGVFERVIPVLDAINLVESNRADAVEQFVQAFLTFKNVSIDEEEYAKFLELGAIKYNDYDGRSASVDYIKAELNQVDTQTLVDSWREYVLTLCAIPNRNGGSSTSDTGSAVELRDGWSDADLAAKEVSGYFKASEIIALERILYLLRVNNVADLSVIDVDIKFFYKILQNLVIGMNTLVSGLNNPHIDNLDAWILCGLVIDPEAAYARGKAYNESLGQEVASDGGIDTDTSTESDITIVE